MATTNILDFAKKYISLARTRGLTPRNPITFEFKPYQNNQNDVYQLVVSHTEPSFADKPYNLLWLDSNSGSPSYQTVLLRTSHTSDGVHRGTWETISEYANLFKSSQFFRKVVENASDLGIEAGDLNVPLANTTRLGKVILKDNQANSIAVSSSDPRMSDARNPTAHDHADYPRSLIRINSRDFAHVGNSPSPKGGDVLVLVDRDPTNSHKFIGEWRKPSMDIVDWLSPRLLNLRISLPGNASYMSDNTSIKLVATAEWENTVVQDPTGVIWSIEENAVNVTISADGTVTVPDLGADVVLVVTAKLRDPVYGNIVIGTYNLHIRNVFVPDDTVESISISGASTLNFRQRETYIVYALFTKGGLVAISPDNFSTDNQALILTGMVGEGSRVSADAIAKLSASYVYNGNTYYATKDVTVKAQVMTELMINGAALINSQAEESYTFTAVWSNGDREQVTPDFFQASPSQYTVIAGNKVTAKKETEANRTVQLQAGYTSGANNQFIEAQKTITIVKEAVELFLTDFVIQGANTIIEGRSSTYRFLAIMNDESSRTVDPDTFVSSNVSVAYIVNKTVNAAQVEQDTVVTLSATYTYKGITRSATFDVTVVNVVPSVALTLLTILGDSNVEQNTQHEYSVLATYSDGHTLLVQPDEFKMVTTTSYAQFDNASGTLTIGAVDIPALNLVLSATYTENEITKTTSKTVVVTGQPATKVRIEIVGNATVDEGTTATYTAHYLMSDNTTQAIPNLSWTILQGQEYATIGSTSGVLNANQVTQDQTVLVRASDGTMTAQKSVVIRNKATDLPQSLMIGGATDVIGGNDSAYTATAIMSSGATPNVTDASSWSVTVVSGTVVPTIVKGVLTTTVVSAVAVVRITAVYQLEDAIVSATRDINVLPADVPTAYGPRFGAVTKIGSVAGYNKAFFESLTTNLTDTGEQFVDCPAGATTEANNKFFYVAWPARLGYGYFRDYTGGSYGFAGSWDGAMEFGDFNFVGAAEVTIDGVLYYIYRADFPFGPDYTFRYSIQYGSSTSLSGMP